MIEVNLEEVNGIGRWQNHGNAQMSVALGLILPILRTHFLCFQDSSRFHVFLRVSHLSSAFFGILRVHSHWVAICHLPRILEAATIGGHHLPIVPHFLQWTGGTGSELLTYKLRFVTHRSEIKKKPSRLATSINFHELHLFSQKT